MICNCSVPSQLQQFNYNGSDTHDMPEIFSGNRRRFDLYGFDSLFL